MRRFGADYLTETRRGMWEDSRDALADLRLSDATAVLDVGCGTGELTAVLREESSGRVVGLDRDSELLAHARNGGPVVRGDARSLPFPDDAFDVVVCQALLVNLPDPAAVVREFARVARERVAAIEPDNAAVTVDSTVDAEAALARRARERYLRGAETDVALGANARAAFEDAGLVDVRSRRYDHERVVEPPYADHEVAAATRKASGADLRERRGTMAGSEEELDALRESWRDMGREVVRQVRDEAYERREVVPFHVVVGHVGGG
ncbi:class I SAM-dependent methyltransferase [Haloglomus litoreum]|uniref:class I SAM-dependent methyltransferase n=1 Tax=Haloglomus litoreum TaxID=3034026 RepID=UPI0023E780A2|nr:class I SAM-dependent methyltransferase [Haloglomus sp. DT116]